MGLITEDAVRAMIQQEIAKFADAEGVANQLNDMADVLQLKLNNAQSPTRITLEKTTTSIDVTDFCRKLSDTAGDIALDVSFRPTVLSWGDWGIAEYAMQHLFANVRYTMRPCSELNDGSGNEVALTSLAMGNPQHSSDELSRGRHSLAVVNRYAWLTYSAGSAILHLSDLFRGHVRSVLGTAAMADTALDTDDMQCIMAPTTKQKEACRIQAIDVYGG